MTTLRRQSPLPTLPANATDKTTKSQTKLTRVVTNIIDEKFTPYLGKAGILQSPVVSKGCGNECDIYEQLSQNESNQMEDYAAPLWLKQTWSVPDGLSGSFASSKTDHQLKQFYEALQHTLYETGFPETIDMTRETKKISPDQVTVGMLSSHVECMSVLLAGGEQCPGDMLLILSHTWCSKQPSPCLAKKYSLYVHQAVAFYRGGYTFLERYDPPRRVTYFVNFFTNTCTDGACCEGEELEKDLDCPMSSSLKLNEIVDDKLYTRILLGKAGVGYPVTLAFRYKATDLYENEYKNESLRITVVPLYDDLSGSASKHLVKNEIRKFLDENKNSSFDKLVVKPSGASWYGSKLISFHDKTDVEEITAATEDVIGHLREGDSVLLEEFIPFEKPEKQKKDGTNEYSVRIRSTVCRTSSGKPRTTQITCGIGVSDQPINGDNTIPISLELFMKKFGFSELQIQDIRRDIEFQSERCMSAIIQNEAGFSEEKRGEIGAQTDVIGIDLILKKKHETYDVVIIEVNSHDCMINCQVYESINRNLLHQAAADLVETMITRSNAFLIKDKTLLIIGVGGYSKLFIFEEANKHGINVVLVDTEYENSMPKVSAFIQHDLNDLRNIEKISMEIIQKLHYRQIHPDGCVSFWEDFAPVAAAICDKLNLVGSTFRAAIIAKNKFLTQQILSKRKGDIPHFPRTFLYTSETHQINSRADIHKAINENSVTLPCILKLLYGSSAVGVHLVKDEEECLQYFDEIQERLDIYGVGLGFGSSMMLTDFIIGSEHDVDIIIFKRKLITAFVSDNGPTRVPEFTETVSVMPSILDEESKNQLITTAYQCCIEAGLDNGIFNVELMMTIRGPKLLEINARMGGYYLRDWILQCYDVDICLYTMMIAMGIHPHVRTKKPTKSLVGVMCVPSEHIDLFCDEDIQRKLQEKHDNGSIRYHKFQEEFYRDKFEYPVANVAAFGSDAAAAKNALINLCNTFQISTSTYNVEEMLSFVPS